MRRCGITLLISLRCRTSFVRTLCYLIRILTVYYFTVNLEHDSRFFMHPSTTWPHEGFATRNNRSLPALMRLASRESENLPPSGFRPRIGRFSCRTLRACGVPASCACDLARLANARGLTHGPRAHGPRHHQRHERRASAPRTAHPRARTQRARAVRPTPSKRTPRYRRRFPRREA